MKTSLRTIFTAVLVILCAVYCTPNDLNDIKKRVDDIEGRVATLEEQVKTMNEQTIPGLRSLVTAITTDNVWVTAVVQQESGYEIKFSDGNSVVVSDGKDGEDGEDGADGNDAPVVNIALVDGNYVWTINGEVVLGEDGKPLRVVGTDGTNGTNGITPQFGIQDGHWIVSYDNGETWQTVGLVSDTDYSAYLAPDEETDDYIVLYVGSTRVEIPKEKVFTLNVVVGENNGVKKGETASFAYTIAGVGSTDEVEVDVLGAAAGWDAVVEATDNASGSIKVTNNSDGNGKVIVYAANHKGKSDIRTLVFEGGKLEAVIETKDITAEGGTMALEVTTNLDYTIEIPTAAQSWISCAEVKATHTDKYTITVAANESGSYRSATVKVVDAAGASIKDIEVFQYPNPTVTTSIASVVALANNTPANLFNVTVVAASKSSTIVTDGEGFIYVADTSIVAGTVVNITNGVKKTDAIGVPYLSGATAAAVEGATPVSFDERLFVSSYYSVSEKLCFDVLNGYVRKVGDKYYLQSFTSALIYALEDPVDELNVDSFVDKFVAFKGWRKGRDASDKTASYVLKAIPTEIKAVVPTPETSWVVSHSESEDSNAPEAVTNTVSGEMSGEYYAFVTVHESELAEASMNGVIAAATEAAWAISDDIIYEVDGYGAYYDEILEYFAYNKTATENFPEFDYGKTYIVAVGIDTLGRVNGKFSAIEYNKVDPAVKAAYADYIGVWKVNGSEWVISAKEDGVSYNIEGIPGSASLASRGGNTVVVGDYDSEKGRLSVTEQVLATYDDPSTNNYGQLKDYFSGVFSYNNRQYRNYPVNGDPGVIFTFVKNADDTYELRAGSCENGKFVGAQFQWIIQEGTNAGKGNTYGTVIALPTKNVEKDKSVKASYDTFIGKFKLGSSVVTISAKEDGKNYNVEGFPVIGTPKGGVKTPVLDYNAEKGILEFNEQDLGTYDDETYGACQEMISATFTIGANQYLYYPVNSPNSRGTIFTISVDADGVFSVAPGEGSYGLFDGYKLAYSYISDPATGKLGVRAYGTSPIPASFEKYVPENDETPVVKAAYADFIGTWTVGANTWVISQKEANATYNIVGLPDATLYEPVTAVYDAENGTFYVMEQDLSPWEDEGIKYRDNVSGVFVAGGTQYAYYPINGDTKNKIFTASKKESGNFVFDLGECEYGDYVGICYSYIVTEGEYAGQGATAEKQILSGVIAHPAAAGSAIKAARSVKANVKKVQKAVEVSAKPRIAYPAAVANNVPAKSSAKVKKFVK